MPGMQLAGWRLESANFQSQRAEFSDTHHRFVNVISDIGQEK